MPNPLFNVAISFLARDEALALELRDKLADGLTVFVYSKEQEQLAGTDGLESLREAFRSAARVVVVLYRDGWGATPWTRVEQTAITDRALAEGWDFLLFVMLDRTSSPPKWLPDTRIRLALPEYGIEQTVGAIKARVQEQGGAIRQLDAVARARIAAERLKRHREIESTLSVSGHSSAQAEFATVLKEISQLTERIREGVPTLELKCGGDGRSQVITTGPASMNVYGFITHPARDSKVIARFWLGRILLPEERGRYTTSREPEEHEKREFHFDLRQGLGWCWVSDQSGEAFLSAQLAEHLVSRFVAFAEAVGRGELGHSEDEDD